MGSTVRCHSVKALRNVSGQLLVVKANEPSGEEMLGGEPLALSAAKKTARAGPAT